MTAGSTAEATKEPGERDHAGVIGNASVWYRWTAPRSGAVVFDAIRGTTFDTLVAVYTGADVGSLVQVASNDDVAPFTRLSRAQFTSVAGQAYLVAVDGVAGKRGTFRLHWAMRPPNDEFAAAERLGGTTGTLAADNSLATRQVGEPRHGSRSVWYVWTAPVSGRVQFDTRGSRFDTVLAAYRGRRLSSLRLVALNDDAFGLQSLWRLHVVAGRTYRLAVSSYPFGGGSGPMLLRWQRL